MRFAIRATAPAVVASTLLLGCSGENASVAAPTTTASPSAPASVPPTTIAPTTPPATTAPTTTAPPRTTPPPRPRGTALKVGLPGFPTAVTDGRGRAVYLFSTDNRGRTTCVGQCATAWPPVLATGTPSITGAGSNQRLVGTRTRPDGRRQVTYAGWGLYYFFRDDAPGEVSGAGRSVFGGTFRLIAANGAMLR